MGVEHERWGPLLGCLCAVTIFSWTGRGEAQNLRSVPLGGRTANMGNAGVAAGNDSAMPFLNPAGLGGIGSDAAGLSASLYGHTQRTINGLFFPTANTVFGEPVVNSESISTSNFLELPSTLMYLAHLSDPQHELQHRVGVSLTIPYVTQTEIIASADVEFPLFSQRFRQSYSSVDNLRTYYLGPSYALSHGDSLRVGGSLFGVVSRQTSTVDSSSVGNGAGTTATSATAGSLESTTFGVAANLGIQLQVADHVWLGASFLSPTIPVTGEASGLSRGELLIPDTASRGSVSELTQVSFEVERERRDPGRLSLGFAYDDREAFSVAFDGHYHLPQNDFVSQSGTESTLESRSGDVERRLTRREGFSVDTAGVFNASLGVELAVSSLIALRAGAFTDFAASEEIGSGTDQVGRLRLDRYAGTLGVGFRAGELDSSIGLVGIYGTGKYGAADSFSQRALAAGGRTVPVDSTETTVLLVVSGVVTVDEAKQQMQETLPVKAPSASDVQEGLK